MLSFCANITHDFNKVCNYSFAIFINFKRWPYRKSAGPNYFHGNNHSHSLHLNGWRITEFSRQELTKKSLGEPYRLKNRRFLQTYTVGFGHTHNSRSIDRILVAIHVFIAYNKVRIYAVPQTLLYNQSIHLFKRKTPQFWNVCYLKLRPQHSWGFCPWHTFLGGNISSC